MIGKLIIAIKLMELPEFELEKDSGRISYGRIQKSFQVHSFGPQACALQHFLKSSSHLVVVVASTQPHNRYQINGNG